MLNKTIYALYRIVFIIFAVFFTLTFGLGGFLLARFLLITFNDLRILEVFSSISFLC